MNAEITAIYAALSALLILGLAYRVVRFRRSLKIGYGDQENEVLAVAIRAHANMVEYTPITLLLLLLAEINGASGSLVHAAGLIFVVSRLAHAWGFTTANGGYSVYRFYGTLANWILLVALSAYHLL
jgi:uncharacterized membrane protein YecN with MAPEG domain